MRLLWFVIFFVFQAEDGIRDLVRSRGLGDVYKRQVQTNGSNCHDVPPLGLRVGLPAYTLPLKRSEVKLSLIHI